MVPCNILATIFIASRALVFIKEKSLEELFEFKVSAISIIWSCKYISNYK